jgi:hypothetical protein
MPQQFSCVRNILLEHHVTTSASNILGNPGSQGDSRLKHFPVSWFSTVMGMTGLSIAWNRAEYFFNPGFCLSSLLLAISSLWLLLLTLVYAGKIIKYPAEVMAEINHPVKQGVSGILCKRGLN